MRWIPVALLGMVFLSCRDVPDVPEDGMVVLAEVEQDSVCVTNLGDSPAAHFLAEVGCASLMDTTAECSPASLLQPGSTECVALADVLCYTCGDTVHFTWTECTVDGGYPEGRQTGVELLVVPCAGP